MSLLFQSTTDRGDWWAAELRRHLPDLDVRLWPDVGDPSDIDCALVWYPPAGMLASLPRLRAVFSLGAGVDHLFADPSLPAHATITRVVDPLLTLRMVEYVVQHVLHYHRDQDRLDAQQRAGQWLAFDTPSAGERGVGILGLGELGGAAAAALAALGFDVAGWSRARRHLPGIRCYAGDAELDAFLARSEILVCLLPLTDATRDLLAAPLFARLPHGAALINAARGAHLVEADLLDALDSGRLRGATLDVTRREPLPEGHAFWQHPRIRLTPHIASITDPRSVAEQVAENIRRLRAGEPLLHRVDRGQGY